MKKAKIFIIILTEYYYFVNRKRLDNSSPLFGYFDPLLLIAACAAASLATGTRNGEHDT